MLGHGVAPAFAQDEKNCRIICELKWKAEPTFTIESLGTRPRIQAPDGVVERVSRERVFEAVLALDMRTRLPRIGFTAEAITAPTSDDNAVQLEFESNFYWLTERMSGGWASSHFDVVDQFSPAERPNT